MQVGKWGNSLAVRLPASVEALRLHEGDEIEIEIVGERAFRVARDHRVEDALARLRTLSRPLPPGFRFARDDAHERGG